VFAGDLVSLPGALSFVQDPAFALGEGGMTVFIQNYRAYGLLFCGLLCFSVSTLLLAFDQVPRDLT
jgi:hypothetical protein